MGLFIASRTERDGVLIAYEGEAMSTEEAVERGLLEAEDPEPAPEPAKKAPARRKTTARKKTAGKATAEKAAKED